MRLFLHRFAILSGVLLTLGLLVVSTGAARTIVCISGDNDQFTNSAEGYLRQLYPSPPALYTIGGDTTALINCLANAEAEDSVYVVAHGCSGFFRWGTKYVAGFKGGRAANGTGVVTVGMNRVYPLQLPDNFTSDGSDVLVTMLSCFSATAPSGGKSTAQSMEDAILPGNTVAGFAGQARVQMPTFRLTGGTQAQRNAAYQCLINASPNVGGSAQARVRLWLGSFRPASSGVTPNSLSAATNAINATNCPAAGGAVTVTVDYGIAPHNLKGLPILPLAALSPLGEEEDEDVSVSGCDCEEPIPTVVTTWGGVKALYRN